MVPKKNAILIGNLLIEAPLVLALLFALNGCGTSNTATSVASEDNSASGAAASAAGSALSGSGSGGTQALYFYQKPNTLFASFKKTMDFLPDALASTACPTFKTTSSGCTTSGGTMWLSYSGCTFGTSAASWTGTQAIIMSSGSASCGTFPNPGASANLVRQFVSAASSTTPGSATVTTAFGSKVTMDNSTANLGNFNSDPISASGYANGGYGFKVTFNGSGARSAVNIAEHMTGSVGSTPLFDHSINGSLTITETASAASRTVSGTITVYHNLLKVIGTSTFTSVTHSNTCCYPTSGTIQTSFAAATTANGGTGTSPTTAGSKYVGRSETLTITGCGTGTLVDVNGNTSSVTLSHCG